MVSLAVTLARDTVHVGGDFWREEALEERKWVWYFGFAVKGMRLDESTKGAFGCSARV
jgi:hypothetical protein